MKKFGLLCVICLSFFISNLFAANHSKTKQNYVNDMYSAFLLQSIGKSNMAYYCFKDSYQRALDSGESVYKLIVANELFIWYRTYGWSCQVMSCPSGLVGEYMSYSGQDNSSYSSSECLKAILCASTEFPEYKSEWGQNPQQAKRIREFMFGMAETLSGIFGVTLAGPIGTKVGTPLILDGMRRMVFSLNAEWADQEERRLELKRIEAKAKKARGD